MKRIGLLGGSFDPVHHGHIHIARAAQAQLDLDSVRLIPCHKPPHKHGFMATDIQRFEMLSLALEHEAGLEIETYEFNKPDTSYTVDTLRHLRNQLGSDVALVFIMGWDSWINLSSWKSWQALFEYCHVAVLRRPGCIGEVPPEQAQFMAEKMLSAEHLATKMLSLAAGYCTILGSEERDISSTDLRSAFSQSQPVEQQLTPSVKAYIEAQGLYGFKYIN